MKRTIHFIAGMPLSGASLLSSILHQNPRFDASRPGGVLTVLNAINGFWPTVDPFKTAPNEAGRLQVLSRVLREFHAAGDRPVVFDRSRGWLAYLELAESLIGREARVLVPVRDLREILAELELLWRRDITDRPIEPENRNAMAFQVLEGRLGVWMDPAEGIVGQCYARIEDAMRRGLGDRMEFVSYEALTARPQQTLDSIYEFLEVRPFKHDLSNLRQVTASYDHWIDSAIAHQIRPCLEPARAKAAEVLGPVAERYKGPYVWDPVLAALAAERGASSRS